MALPRPAMRAAATLMHRYRQHVRGLTMGARGLVLREAAGGPEVFLIRHTYAPGFQLPGGGIEPGESAGEALVRELWEEGRIRPTSPPPLFGLYHNGPAWPRDHVALYVVRAFTQTEAPRPDAEIAEHVWAPLDALPETIQASARQRIAEVVGGAAVTPTWRP